MNENTTYKNMWDIIKVVLKGKFIAPNFYIREKGLKSTIQKT